MPTITATVECPVKPSFRVSQLSGLFDVPPTERSRQEFTVELPADDEDWQIGAIVGPSGSGKSTCARKAFGDSLYIPGNWPPDVAVVDGFPAGITVKAISQALAAVGFSSPPAWLRPYEALSNGEKFRCDLARALLSGKPIVAFDEFTSVVDRTVAKVGSAAVSKAVRSGKQRFVAVTCHYDVLEWLEPDWVLDMAAGKLARGRLQRPQVNIEVFRCERVAWDLFARHHYLDASLHRSAQCYLATWDGRPVALCAMMNTFGYKAMWRISRIVTLPDYQGLGVGTRLMEYCAGLYVKAGNRVTITASHPAIVRHCEKSALWKLMMVKKGGNRAHGRANPWTQDSEHPKPAVVSAGRAVVAFEFVHKAVKP